MKKITSTVALLFLILQVLLAQSPELVVDFIAGPQGSIEGRIFEYKGALLYLGITQDGERAILRYDKNTDEVSVLIRESEVEGEFRIFWTTSKYVLLATDVNDEPKLLFKSSESDLSDLTEVYDSGNATLASLRYTPDDIIISEIDFENVTEPKSNFIQLDNDNNVTPIFEGLSGYTFNYNITTANGYFFLAPEQELIDNQAIFAFDLTAKEFVPFKEIVPTYEECGLIVNMYPLADRILVYECENSYIYDFINDQNIEIEGGFDFLFYDNDAHLFFLNEANEFIKLNKSDGSQEVLFSDIITSRGYFNHIMALRTGTNGLSISYMDYEDGTPYSYETNYDSINLPRFTAPAIVPEGIHTVLYSLSEDQGVLIKINSESFTEIDSVYNVNFNNRPIAYDEDIYFTHQDPEFGNELFFIDYEVSSTQNIISSTSIQISPNPAQEFIKVKHAFNLIPFSTAIFDANGHLVMKHLQGNEIDISHLASGIYFLRTQYLDGKVGMERFVVE